MSNLLAALIYLTSGTSYKYVDVCESNIDNLSLDKKIEFSIGCSSVSGMRVYSDCKIKNILGRACSAPTSQN